ncbi:hypothetical protein BDU57DRAFT_533960 [Ampelomyces quisqualis]|uniref:Uncharacterized protein n=1 Tax=Ampelomyces quisqualis TaxID=50730 RepID=A0A6A5QZ70_AMPQU|nr:hypothetical protein BDU57DRAFT_533960 [Ampelomyces quisqualis]
MLALGCDAPLGNPTKLLRKIYFIPPIEKSIPRLYTAATDLSEGARIVVVYGETIILYSIPPDIIVLSQTEQGLEGLGAGASRISIPDKCAKNGWLTWWNERLPLDASPDTGSTDSANVWPIAVRGTEIGKLRNICEIAVQTRPDFTFWAFTHTSQCHSWRLRSYVDRELPMKRSVCRNGNLHDLYSFDGSSDNIMENAPSLPPACTLHARGELDEHPVAQRSVMLGFDGNPSVIMKRLPKALSVENDDWVDMIDVRGCSDAWYDGDGDVVMFFRA